MRPGLPSVSASVRCIVLAALITLCCSRSSSADDLERSQSLEFRSAIPARPAAFPHATSTAATVSFGRFTSIQVNVDAIGNNIVGDAANEPSIAVDPSDHNRMAIGWRQFDTVNSTFREAGYGYTTNGGLSWTAGKLDPGVFRSDPVLSFDAQGRFYYLSATLDFTTFDITTDLFVSTNQGQTWGPPVDAFGGDKEWMTADRTGGMGDGQLYQIWTAGTSPTNAKSFARSIDHGQSFQTPIVIPHKPQWGTIDVGADGTVYVAGMNFKRENQVAVSVNARNPALTPGFETKAADIGGMMEESQGPPNGFGLLGQTWIAVDRSSGPRSGWLYMLASVQTPTDPLDVLFIRSTDGGLTWSVPKRVNDDPTGNGAYQWFGTMSVAPNGRIDAVWNDTRGSADLTKSALYYSYSTDGGTTWSTNEQASPVWDSSVGFPAFSNQKVGDYYQMISDDAGADLAWAATFTGEQDVYYLRIAAPAAAPALASRAAVQSLRGPVSIAPNPFTASTAIRFDVPGEGGRTSVDVFDLSGRRVARLLDGFAKGPQTVRWAGTDEAGRRLQPGVYLCRLAAPGTTETLKLMLVK